MHELEHTLFDFPDDPSSLDWNKEALLFYYYMLNEEEKNEEKIQKIFKKFKNTFMAVHTAKERQIAYKELLLAIYDIKKNDNNYFLILAFILPVSKIVNKLEQSLEYIINAKNHAETGIKFFPESTEYFKDELEKLLIEEEKIINKSINDIIRIVRTESWRFVNEKRLEEFKKKGYKYKTTYPVKDDKTGEDSWFYYDEKQVKPIDEPFNYTWEGKERVFMTPPDRPNDRNILIPYFPE